MVWHIKRSIFWFKSRVWDSLGPGLIAGAADDDPSGVATYSVAGAQFGTSLLWTALVTWPLMAAVQMMCARIGMVSGRGLTAGFKKKFPRWLVSVVITALLIANTINVGADLSGMAECGGNVDSCQFASLAHFFCNRDFLGHREAAVLSNRKHTQMAGVGLVFICDYRNCDSSGLAYDLARYVRAALP